MAQAQQIEVRMRPGTGEMQLSRRPSDEPDSKQQTTLLHRISFEIRGRAKDETLLQLYKSGGPWISASNPPPLIQLLFTMQLAQMTRSFGTVDRYLSIFGRPNDFWFLKPHFRVLHPSDKRSRPWFPGSCKCAPDQVPFPVSILICQGRDRIHQTSTLGAADSRTSNAV